MRGQNSLSYPLTVFGGNLFLVLIRSWSGLGRIPSDPNYSAILSRLENRNFSLVTNIPYFHFDTPTLASFIALFPISWHGLVGNLLTHLIWTLSATTISLALARFGINKWAAVVGGLALPLSPWASQSSLGNFGGIRWPILVAVLVYVSVELASETPRPKNATFGTFIASICTPTSFSLLVPMLVGVLGRKKEHKKVALIASTPPIAILVLNFLLTEGGGYENKVSAFWADASMFWTTGQIVPGLFALIGISLIPIGSCAHTAVRRLCLMIFVGAISVALASFFLGGIADRYFVAPSSLTSIGLLLGSLHLWTNVRWRSTAFAILFLVVFIVPAIKWFEPSPWLTDGPTWTSQIAESKSVCSVGLVDQVELVTSDGTTSTAAISCSLISEYP